MSIITITAPLSARAESYLAAVGNGLGVAHVAWTSTVKPAAAHKARTLTKSTTATVMTGAVYADLAVNDHAETGALPWGEWGAFPHIITHKGAEYARLYVIDGTIRTDYYVDGVRVKRDDFLALLTPSAREAKAPNGGCITVKMASVTIL